MMKIKKSTLRRIVKEELLAEAAWEKLAKQQNKELEQDKVEIKTIGQLKKAVKGAIAKKRGKIGMLGGGVDAAAGLLADMLPMGGLVKDLASAAYAAYKLPDEKKTQTGLDALNVDDEVSAIVADEVENAFMKTLSKKLESLPDETPLEKVNMTQLLSQFIANKFNKRTVIVPGEER